MSINKVILVGNVGKDPEVRYLDSGVAVAKFPFATSETYRNKNNEKVTNTEWHNIVLWRALAELAEKYIKKGSQLYIEGRIRTRSYDDKEGNKRYITEIYGDNVRLLGRKSETSTEETNSSSQVEETFDDILPGNDDTADDLPF
ncbi:MAG: single-stranded DNA-binding protein [Bacteroidales bacterium]|nr:single-stranded DNA-binding protein [Bacteroidales bacterium]